MNYFPRISSKNSYSNKYSCSRVSSAPMIQQKCLNFLFYEEKKNFFLMKKIFLWRNRLFSSLLQQKKVKCRKSSVQEILNQLTRSYRQTLIANIFCHSKHARRLAENTQESKYFFFVFNTSNYNSMVRLLLAKLFLQIEWREYFKNPVRSRVWSIAWPRVHETRITL